MIVKDNVLKIWDPVSGKLRNVKDLRVVSYDSGQVVEFTVIGASREWPMFVSIDIFKETNPSVDLKDI